MSLAPEAPPAPGEFLLTTRLGAERDLVEELIFYDAETRPHPVAPALVAARRLPRAHAHAPIELAFARQGFLVAHLGEPDAPRLAREIVAQLARHKVQPWALDAWVPDSDEGNLLQHETDRLAEHVIQNITSGWAAARVKDGRAAHQENGLYAQIARFGRLCAVGVTPARDAISLAPGGRLRVHVAKHAPSRAAGKLLEAFAWLDRAPERGEVCVDLGAAPGGWTWVLLERGCKVYAVDPASLHPSLRGRKGFEHIRADAFKFDPGQTEIDWLFGDMAWRPLEAASLLARWARRRWSRLMVANLKLPMKKKAEMLFRIKEILADGGWASLRARQLYHDREEVTVAGVRL